MNRSDIMVNSVDVNRKFYDPMADFRDMVLAGALNNGKKPVSDRRSKDTTSL
jgi:hypothetical protein